MARDFKRDERRMRGFERASSLLTSRIRTASESRGFSVSRLLTHWREIVGDDIADMSVPVRVSYAQKGFGATLTLLTTGAQAPLVQTQGPKIREAVNRCYGYNAISAVKVTQTAATGFAEGEVAFRPKSGVKTASKPLAAEVQAEAKQISAGVADTSLRGALEKMGANVLSRITK